MDKPTKQLMYPRERSRPSRRILSFVSTCRIAFRSGPPWMTKCALALAVGLLSSASLGGLPLDIPGNQTFDNLETAAVSYERSDVSEEIKQSVAVVKRMIDRGRLLMVAGRMRASAILAERAWVHIALIKLLLVIEALEKEADGKATAQHEKEQTLQSLKLELAKWAATEPNGGRKPLEADVTGSGK